MTKGEKLYSLLVVVLSMHYPHLNDMTVNDACHNAYLNDHFALHSILNVMRQIYPEYGDKTFRRLQSKFQDIQYKELKEKQKNNESV